ncbi:hypothetical protein ACOMHN_048903 [Nucella lapillus]
MVGDAVVTYNGVSRVTCAARCASKYPCGGFTHSATDKVCMLCGLCGNFSLVDAPGYRLYVLTDIEESPQSQDSLCPSSMAIPQKCWKLVPGSLKHVSVGLAGTWGVNRKDLVFYRPGTYQHPHILGSVWTPLNGMLSQLDVGGVTTWGVNSHGIYYHRKDTSLARPTGSSWSGYYSQIRLGWISASPRGSLWGRDTAGRVVHYQNSTWLPMGMDIQRVDAGLAGVWVLNTTGHLFYRTGTHGDRGTAGTGWQAVQGTFSSVASGRDLVVAVDMAGQVWLRTGLGPDTPTGLAWLRYPGSMQQVDVYQTQEGAALWGVQASTVIYFSILKD